MMLSTRGRYAVMAMVDLAVCTRQGEKEGKPVCLSDISERQEIPLAYLEQIFAKLRKSGLITSVRGPGGGYKLGRPAGDIWMSDIIMAAEEPLKMTRCESGPKGCMAAKARCLTHDLWEGLGQQIYHYLRSISLEDVCDKQVRIKLGLQAATPESLTAH